MTTAPATDQAPAGAPSHLARALETASLPALIAVVIDRLADAIDAGQVPEGVSAQQWLRAQAEDLRAAETPAQDGPEPRYPHVRVRLLGEDGNALFIMGRVGRALRAAGVDSATREEFVNEAFSGDYDHVLRTVRDWVTISDDGFGD